MEALKQDEKKLPEFLQTNLQYIFWYQKQIENTPEDDYVERINLMAKMLVFIGRVAAYCKTEAKAKYIERKRVYWQTYQTAPKPKEMNAELAVIDLREEELEWFGMSERWNNAFITVREEINALKYKQRLEFEDGSSRIK
jgi:hypothetical protein